MVQEKKRCSTCGKNKVLDEFGLNKRCLDGHRKICKACLERKRKARLKGGVDTRNWKLLPEEEVIDNIPRNRGVDKYKENISRIR